MSSNLSIGYFFNQFNSVGNDNFTIYADMSVSGNSIPNLTGTHSPTGIRASGNKYSYFQNTGNEVDYTNATYAMIYEKSGNGGATLISNIELVSGSYYQGFEFGVTANNRLYFEYYSPNGPQVFSAPGNLSDKEAVFLTIFNNSVLMGSYDFYSNSVSNSLPFVINGDYLFNPSGVYLGYNPKATGLYSYNKQLTGTISEFTVFSPSLYPLDVTYVMSGFVNNHSAPTNYINYINTTGITGYATGITGYYTAVTGYSIVATGVITNSFGITHTGYTSIPLSGTLSGSGVIALTGITQIATSGYSGESVSLDTSKVLSFGKSNINILAPIGLVQSRVLTGVTDYSLEQNATAKYDSVNDSYHNPDFLNGINFVVYADGRLKAIGDSYVSGNIYSSVTLPVNDYFVDSNNEVFFDPSFSGNNVIFEGISYDTAGTMSINSPFVIRNNTSVGFNMSFDFFWNGKLLTSGKDFIYTNPNILFTGSYASGTGCLIAIQRPIGVQSIFSGVNRAQSFTKPFATNYSNIYVNGLKITPNIDYLELAKFDLNSGSGIFDIKSGLLYNSTDLS